MNQHGDSHAEQDNVELKFRQAIAAEARAEREMREKVQKWFYIGVAVFVVLFTVAMLFF